MKKKAVVAHSGGMDSSIVLRLAIKEFSKEDVLSLTFSYGQRNLSEIQKAKKIAFDWKVDHTVIDIHCLKEITDNALINKRLKIEHFEGYLPNTLVVGRNGLFARLAGIYANHIGAKSIYMGVIELEESNSGYRDCSRKYMDLMQEILRIDFDDPDFEIRTPLVKLTKKETLNMANKLNVLDYLIENTISCYEGLPHPGCGKCPACILRNEGIQEFIAS